jgi:hypothetical protein
MGKVDSSLLNKIKSSPDSSVRVIVRVDGDLDEATRKLADKGARPSKTLKLINAVVVICRARDIAGLARQRFVKTVEEDRIVKSQAS